ncbi:ROK family transcriptional regulator [Mycolicibacterium brumae]|uniref:ROK family protein n=1 Tax=Mycolicibacterium brumae TaxID=85968 RepID=A0A2G5PHK0_9MYCO|nr:ROK family transcriptional regulator [Mycolicibacterium brumae]PIB77503.1 ROK family protein [Mycolicibacterium brumae]
MRTAVSTPVAVSTSTADSAPVRPVTAAARAAHPTRLHPVRPRRHVVSPALQVAESASAAVFGAVRARGPIARDTIARSTDLSIATVNRQVTALLDAGLLRERADLTIAGAIGRPRIPVEVNHEPFLTLGVHIGARSTSIVATDLLGRALDAVETPTPRGGQQVALAAVAASAQRYLTRWRRRRVLSVGVSIGGTVHSATGYVDHPRLGWTEAPVGPVLATALGLPTSVAAHVEAMAGAELLLGRTGPERGSAPRLGDDATRLYVYARETVGYALVIGGRVHSPASGPGTIAGLPVRSDLLGGDGTLEATVSDEAVLTAARQRGVAAAIDGVAAVLAAARGGDETAAALLRERARILGESTALLRDLLNPDELVVGGQAFTDYPEELPTLREAFAARSALAPRAIRLTTFGNRVQEAGAGIVSLSALFSDPIRALRRAQ